MTAAQPPRPSPGPPLDRPHRGLAYRASRSTTGGRSSGGPRRWRCSRSLSASRLRFNPDILSLIPQNNKEVNDFREVVEKTGTLDQHIVVVEIPPGGRWRTTSR